MGFGSKVKNVTKKASNTVKSAANTATGGLYGKASDWVKDKTGTSLGQWVTNPLGSQLGGLSKLLGGAFDGPPGVSMPGYGPQTDVDALTQNQQRLTGAQDAGAARINAFFMDPRRRQAQDQYLGGIEQEDLAATGGQADRARRALAFRLAGQGNRGGSTDIEGQVGIAQAQQGARAGAGARRAAGLQEWDAGNRAEQLRWLQALYSGQDSAGAASRGALAGLQGQMGDEREINASMLAGNRMQADANRANYAVLGQGLSGLGQGLGVWAQRRRLGPEDGSSIWGWG